MESTDPLDENLEQSQESADDRQAVSREAMAAVHARTGDLLRALEDLPDGDMVAEVIVNALKLLRDNTNRGDIKLINKSFKELRYALRIFAPYRDVRKVSIFGSARTPETAPEYRAALDFGRRMAEAGWMVITGAGGGIMAAGHGGAGAEPSFGLAIRLPFEQKTNDFIANDPKLINFKYFFTRKLMFVRSSHAIALFPGGFGTMDEGFEVLTLVQTGKSAPVPIVMVDAPGDTYWEGWDHYVRAHLLERGLISPEDLQLYRIARSVDEAVEEVRRFYRNYHSLRYVRELLVLRLRQAPDAAQIDRLNGEFADLLDDGAFVVRDALPAERDEPDLARMPRLVFQFNRRDHARLRVLIDRLNDLPG